MQAPGHRHPPQEAESLRLEPPPHPGEGLTPGQLVQRVLRPSLRFAAWQVTRLPEKASSPAPGSSTPPLQGGRPRPWQESCCTGDHTCPPSSAAWLRTGAQQAVV
ncbi:unnamed protein product [Rangifer tarandus platyrhynchus]|uniref:Uncharacterized protein n=1 Tax=Rangifer tarandus platyrhynchus TaxID=3082113 RepID=A0ACB1KF62_RANTA